MIEEKNKENIELEIVKNSRNLEGFLYYKYFKVAPLYEYMVYDLHESVYKDLENLLERHFSLDLISKSEYSMESGGAYNNSNLIFENNITSYKIDIHKKMMVVITEDTLNFISNQDIGKELKSEIKAITEKGIDTKNKSSVHILTTSSDGMELTDFKIDDMYNDLNLEENYNDGFTEVHENIIDKLESNNVGLYMLHGKPGTGKTTYIRHLIRKISKRVIFISPSMSNKISDPSMVPFMMRFPNSILIIEDAENVIESRTGGDNQSVSNLLNLSDGILGDCLKFQIICTFNTDKNDIDEALMRGGRLLKSYEFEKLELSKTNKLLKKLGHSPTDEPKSLSDIYNQESNNMVKRSRIGF